MANNTAQKDKETLLNSPAPNKLAVVKTGSEIPRKIIKIIFAIIILGGAVYFLFK